MNELKVSDALGEIFAIFKRANKYIDENEPWVLAKNENFDRLNVVLYNLLESLAIGSSLLQPFMPKTSEKVFEFLNVKPRSFSCLNEFGLEECFDVRKETQILFPRFDVKEINKTAEIIKEKQILEHKKMLENEKMISEEKNKQENNQKVENEENVIQKGKPEIEYSDFEKIELKVGTIVASEKVENAEKLLKFSVKIGDEIRTIVSGVYPHYNPEYMLNKQVVVVANLKPRKIRGIESKGMILYAEDEKNGKLLFITPEKEIESGSEVC